MTIKEIEDRTGLPRANIRFYESQGLIAPSRGENGYRDYSQEDCQTLLKIKLLRKLDCSLEDIRSLQAGERSLDQLLEQRLAQLEGRYAELEQAKALCQKLREDRADWSSMDPARYLSWAPSTPADEVADIRFRIPWRRYFARSLDLLLYGTLWSVLLALVFRINILWRGPLGDLLDTAATLTLMAALEPLFLHRWGTTPGKALFRLKLTRSDGSYLSLQEGFRRTLSVIIMGLGLTITLSILALIPLVTLILGYVRCKKGREQPWALEDEAWSDGTDGTQGFWDQPRSGRRAAAYPGIYALCVALLMGAALFAAIPRHHGALTPEEFAANYNHLATFASAPEEPGYMLQPDGSWLRTDPNSFPIFLFGSGPLDMDIQSQQGVVTGLAFSMENREQGGVRSLSTTQVWHTVNALLGHGELLAHPSLKPVLSALKEPRPGTQSWTVDGWQLTLELELKGYDSHKGQLVSLPGQEQYVRYDFSIRQI